jgi:cellulose synthase (UDP-forming)
MKTTTRISLCTAALVLLVVAALLRDLHLIIAGSAGSVYSRLFSLLLVVVLFVGAFHFISYADHLMRSLFVYADTGLKRTPLSPPYPGVAVFIPVYNEETAVVESCLFTCSRILYPAQHVYLLDDSSDPQVREANSDAALRYGASYVHRTHRRGFKAGAINHGLSLLGEGTEYLLVLDADQQVKPDILSDLIPVLEGDSTVSFIQTPQFFRAEPKDALSVTFSYQQHLYNKHVCRGLSVNRAVMLTGSNSLFRMSHLREIGGMDEGCITEDVATAFAFHHKGRHGLFLDTVYAEGISPPNLSAYHTQQLRWAYGNTQLLGTVFATLLRHPRSMAPLQWYEFFVSLSVYLLGGVNLTLFLLPCITLLLGIPILPVWLPVLFVAVMVGVLAIQVRTSMRERHYSFRDLLSAQAIFNNLSFVYARALWYVATRRRLPFMVTPKTIRAPASGGPQVRILPVLAVLAAVALSIGFGAMKIAAAGPDPGTTIPLFWACYTLVVLGSFLPIWQDDRRKISDASGRAADPEDGTDWPGCSTAPR